MLQEYSIYREQRISGTCPDEPNFEQMYANLGNREAQELIRQSNSKVEHCTLLQQSPNACIGCPKNPYKKHPECDVEFVEDNFWLLSYVYELFDNYKLGTLETLSPAEFTLLKMFQEHQQIQEQVLQARLIRNEISKLFSSEK